MMKYKLKSVMLTTIHMERLRLITTEKMEKYCKGEDEDRKDSVNDDLESFFEDLRLGKKPNEMNVYTYFLPRLTEEEMELVERKDQSYLASFRFMYPELIKNGYKKLPGSDSNFVEGWGWRRTFTIENKSLQNNTNCCNLQ